MGKITHLLDLKDVHNLIVNIVYNKTPQGTF